MASSNTTSTIFGASIVSHPPATSAQGGAISLAALDSPAASREDLAVDLPSKPIPPHSPFYQHPPQSFERVHSRQSSKDEHVAINEKDLEDGFATPLAVANSDDPFTQKISVDCNQECQMWPSRNTLIQGRLADKKRRRERKMCGGCDPVVGFWQSCPKRQRLYIKIAIAVLVAGVIVAIAVGITVSVHGNVVSSHGQHPVGEAPGT